MRRVLALANIKGGVGKTTGAVSLAAALGELGERCLVVDLDIQGAASLSLGVENRGQSLLDCLRWRESLEGAVTPSVAPGVDVAPGGRALGDADRELFHRIGPESRLRVCLERTEGPWRWIFVDCPAGLGLFTLNGLVAADGVLLPIDGQPLALEGLKDLEATLGEIRDSGLNPSLDVVGVLPSRCHPRRGAHRRGLEALEAAFPGRVGPIIRENVALVEAPERRTPVGLYAPRSRGAEDYRAAALWLRNLLGP